MISGVILVECRQDNKIPSGALHLNSEGNRSELWIGIDKGISYQPGRCPFQALLPHDWLRTAGNDRIWRKNFGTSFGSGSGHWRMAPTSPTVLYSTDPHLRLLAAVSRKNLTKLAI